MDPSTFPKARELKMYIEGGLNEVEGWLGGDASWVIVELSRLLTERGDSGPVAEIGVHHGQLLILMALTQPKGGTAVGIDLFEDQAQNLDSSGHGDRQIFERNAQAAGVDLNDVHLLQVNSKDLSSRKLLNTTFGERIRMFSIDGGHSAELTLNDLDLASRTLSSHGIVVLDDAFSPMWPGVMTGLMSFLNRGRRSQLIPFGLVGNKTLLARRDVAHSWFTSLEPAGAYFETRVDYFAGHIVRILLDSPDKENAWRPEQASWWR